MSRDHKPTKSNQIRRYRKKRCLRQRDVARMLGQKTEDNLYRWEADRALPSLTNALKLSAALKCPVELLFLDHYKRIRRKMYGEERLE